MEPFARLYQCARCHHQVVICSDCDRGNLYCAGGCARAARTGSLRAAGQRYQRTRRGRFKHAERQRRYRSRCKKVTHQGSPEPPPHDPLTTRAEEPLLPGVIEEEGIRCHFCRRLCGDFLRLDFLHRTRPALTSAREVTHGPSKLRAQAP